MRTDNLPYGARPGSPRLKFGPRDPPWYALALVYVPGLNPADGALVPTPALGLEPERRAIADDPERARAVLATDVHGADALENLRRTLPGDRWKRLQNDGWVA